MVKKGGLLIPLVFARIRRPIRRSPSKHIDDPVEQPGQGARALLSVNRPSRALILAFIGVIRLRPGIDCFAHGGTSRRGEPKCWPMNHSTNTPSKTSIAPDTNVAWHPNNPRVAAHCDWLLSLIPSWYSPSSSCLTDLVASSLSKSVFSLWGEDPRYVVDVEYVTTPITSETPKDPNPNFVTKVRFTVSPVKAGADANAAKINTISRTVRAALSSIAPISESWCSTVRLDSASSTSREGVSSSESGMCAIHPVSRLHCESTRVENVKTFAWGSGSGCRRSITSSSEALRAGTRAPRAYRGASSGSRPDTVRCRQASRGRTRRAPRGCPRGRAGDSSASAPAPAARTPTEPTSTSLFIGAARPTSTGSRRSAATAGGTWTENPGRVPLTPGGTAPGLRACAPDSPPPAWRTGAPVAVEARTLQLAMRLQDGSRDDGATVRASYSETVNSTSWPSPDRSNVNVSAHVLPAATTRSSCWSAMTFPFESSRYTSSVTVTS